MSMHTRCTVYDFRNAMGIFDMGVSVFEEWTSFLNCPATQIL